MCKNSVICPNCFSKTFYHYGKDKVGNQKFLCKSCTKQFTSKSYSRKQLGYPKCPVCGAGTYLHHDYQHYSRFKCNSKKWNHIHVRLKNSTFVNEMADELKSTKAINLKRLRTDINLVIDALYLYFEASSSTQSIATFGIEKALKYLMSLFTNGLKVSISFLKKLLVNIHPKILALLMNDMLMKLLLKYIRYGL